MYLISYSLNLLFIGIMLDKMGIWPKSHNKWYTFWCPKSGFPGALTGVCAGIMFEVAMNFLTR